jgi:molybdopterin converting factor small subunit
MKVRVKLFAAAKELAGSDSLEIDLPHDATIAHLRQAVITGVPTLSRIVSHSLWAIGGQYAAADTPLDERSEVALIPPVSGG